MNKFLKSLTLVLVAFQLTGCMALTGKRMGAVIDDTVIASNIKSKYMFNNDVHAFWIDVDCHNGDVVLIGSVQTRDEEDVAIRLAKNIAGVRSVTSFLKIKDLEGNQEMLYDQEVTIE